MDPNGKLYRLLRHSGLLERLQYELRRKPELVLPPPLGTRLRIGPGDVIVDCGANVGQVTSRFARSGATVYAIEPHPACCRVLRRRFAWMPTVHLVEAGVMDRPGQLTLSAPRPHAGFDALGTTVAASFVPDAMHSDAYAVDRFEVPCIDLDAFLQELGRRVRLLKVDIEGAEIPVLHRLMDTGTIDRVDLTVVETHERQIPSLREPTDALRRRIRDLGLAERVRLDWA